VGFLLSNNQSVCKIPAEAGKNWREPGRFLINNVVFRRKGTSISGCLRKWTCQKTDLLNINYRSIPVADIPIVSRLAVIKIGHIEEILQNGWQFDPIGQLFFNREITSINHMMLYTKWSDLL